MNLHGDVIVTPTGVPLLHVRNPLRSGRVRIEYYSLAPRFIERRSGGARSSRRLSKHCHFAIPFTEVRLSQIAGPWRKVQRNPAMRRS
jgi:hypothetical protein